MEEAKIKLYTRTDENGVVQKLINTIFNQDEILETDIFIGEGVGDEFAHPQSKYQIIDINGIFNYKIVNGKIKKRTEKEKEQELKSILEKGLDPIIRLEQSLTDLDLRILELEAKNE